MRIKYRLLFACLLLLALAFVGGGRKVSAVEAQYDALEKRDPFVPLIGRGGVLLHVFDPSGYQIEGIIYDQIDGSLALINGEFYREGEKVKEAVVKKIHTDRVIIAETNDEITLWLNPDTQNGGNSNAKKI
ncbi:MAG: hypothetical protein HYZ84_00220 [Candidatus Omnitrophica bacterium]|nr:hypothetical protein [Candidatus Omnitrophota bacterium]